MLLSLKLPQIIEYANSAKIERVFAIEGQYLQPGTKICDLRVDLSAVAPHDCPPVSFFRIVWRDRAWLRRLNIAKGDVRETGEELALFSTEQEEVIDGYPLRPARFTTVGIIYHPDWPDENQA